MSASAATLTRAQADSLEAHVDAVTLALQALAVLLIREREALTHRAAADAIENIARDKHRAVEQVGGLYALLRDSLNALGGSGASLPDSVLALKRTHPNLSQRVERLVALTRDCHRANQDNGVLVSAGLRNAGHAMDTLRAVGAVPAADTATYGPAGHGHRSSAGDRLTVRA